jgi:glutaredoxin
MADSLSNGNAQDKLADLTEPFEIVVFTAQGCPNCPHAVRAASALAAANSMVTVTVLDAGEHAELASRYQVRSVPTLVINGGLTIVGVVTQDELTRRVVELQGPKAEDAVFVSFIKSGRIEDASDWLVDGRGISAFAGLWNKSTLEERIGLSLVAQNSVEVNPSSLDVLVDRILPSLETDDPARRGDTADLLGAIGHESARTALEKLLGDSHEDVAEAAEDALDCINERTNGTGGGSV